MIPFIDLEKQQRQIRTSIEAGIKRVLDHGHYIMGPEVAELEEKLCQFCGASHCITCASGSDALLMALMAWEVGPQDAVFVPAFTFFATAEMAALLGATPVFVDIDANTFNMNPACLREAIERILKEGRIKPKAVIPVDLFGQPADYHAILPICHEYRLQCLEDAAQAFGGSHDGIKTCNLGCDASATSFFPAKPLGCYGDGGAIFTNDTNLAEKLRSIRIHGKGTDKYDNIRLGINGRLDTIQAAILLAKLEIFTEELKLRAIVASWYNDALQGIPDLVPPVLAPGNFSSWAQYSILVHPEKRDFLASALFKSGIPTNIYYPKPLPLLQAFAALSQHPSSFPASVNASKRVLALPFHPYLTQEAINKIAAVIRSLLA